MNSTQQSETRVIMLSCYYWFVYSDFLFKGEITVVNGRWKLHVFGLGNFEIKITRTYFCGKYEG